MPRERRGEHRLVARRDELQVADRDRRPAEHVERAQERRGRDADVELVAVDGAARRPRAPARRRGRPRAGRSATRARRLLRDVTSAGSTSCACSSLVRTFGPYSSARDGERGTVRLGGLVEEERPGVGGRVGDHRLDDAARRAPRGARRTPRPRGSRPAQGRPQTAAASAARRSAPQAAAPGAAPPRAPTTSPPPPGRWSPWARRCRSCGRAETRRPPAPAPSSA